MPRSRLLTAVLGLMLSLSAAAAAAEDGTFYLSPEGDDAADGSRGSPWASLAHASQQAEAGDTIVLLPGEYAGQVRPENSGTADAPITFRAEQRRTARLTGTGGADYTVALDDVAHVRIKGLHVEPHAPNGRWVLIRDSRHITLDDCLMQEAWAGLGMHIDASEQVRVLNSVMRRNTFNMVRIGDSQHVLFEVNAISKAGHSPLQIYPPDSNRYLVIRGNVFHAQWGRSFEVFTTADVLFEHNIITRAYNSGRSASSNAKFAVDRGIFRYNRVFANHGGPLHLYPWRDGPLRHVRMYHNVFDDNIHYGLRTRASDTVEDIVLANNIFSRNDPHGGNAQLVISGERDRIALRHNALSHPLIEGSRTLPLDDDADSATAAANLQADPRFVDAENYDHHLDDDSPLRNAGTHAARTVGEGAGRTLTVDDPRWFYDGFDIEGEVGDRVQVGSGDRRARVVAIDPDDGTLTVDRSLEWDDGEPVSLPWRGESPDIGVWGSGGAVVRIRIPRVETRPGEPVRMDLDTEADLREAVWWLGDGTQQQGQFMQHSYSGPGGYPVRVRAVDQDGDVHRATGYIVVRGDEDPDAPLLDNTFAEDDHTWWWRWQTYRPGPVRWKRVLVIDTDEQLPTPWSHPNGSVRRVEPGDTDRAVGSGYLRIEAPEDEARMPAFVNPAGWDVDRYPVLRLRVRAHEGTPLIVSLRAFRTPEDGSRSARAVAASSTGLDGEDGIAIIPDDGAWHEIELDARAIIRDRHPDVQVLEGIRFQAYRRSSTVKQGHRYDIDRVTIAPD